MYLLTKLLNTKMNNLDIFNIMIEEQRLKGEPINYTIGRLRAAIRMEKDKDYLLELVERISDEVIRLSVKYPDDFRIYE